MKPHSSPTLPAHTRCRWFFPGVSVLAAVASVCTPAATTLAAQAPSTQDTVPGSITGIPKLPNVVTVIPFYGKVDETEDEKTKVVIPVEVDGRRGNFILDLGAPRLNMNRTLLQPNPAGGVDAVTDANRIAEQGHEDSVHVTLRLGTLIDTFVEPTMQGANPRHVNAFLNHMWGNFGNFAPRLGNISLSVLEPFETIIDYTHRRVVLIRLDKTGHRLAQVPAYTPRWMAPLIDMPLAGDARRWWGVAVRPDKTLDTLNATNNTEVSVMDTGATDNDEFLGHPLLGYPFLSQLGIVGFNHRTHQVILYH